MTRRLLLLTAVLVAGVGLVGLWVVKASAPRPKAPDLLKQIHAAFKMYAEEFGGEYPRMSAKRGEFVPDMDAFGEYLARLPQGDLLSAYLTGKCGVQLCYFGYVVPTQRGTLALLDEYEKQGLGDFGDDDVRLKGGRAAGVSYGHVFRLREGIERFFIPDVMNPSATQLTRAFLPVLWELPDTTPGPGGWVLYMDGHTEWLPYGRFPITEKISARLRHFTPTRVTRGSDRAYRVDSRSPPEYGHMGRGSSPVHQIAADIVDCLPALFCKLEQCDVKPSIKVGRYRGYRICLTGDVEVVLFPAHVKVDEQFKHRIWPSRPQKEDVFPVDMGTGHGYRWFTLVVQQDSSVWFPGLSGLTVEQHDHLREEFGLVGGDDRLQLMIDANAFHLMPRVGERAVPDLTSVVTDEENVNYLPYAIMALDHIGGDKAEELIRAAFAADNEDAFRNAVALTEATISPRALKLSDSTLDLIVEALLKADDTEQLVEMAGRFAAPPKPRFGDTSQMRRVGFAVLESLPRDIVDRTFEKLREKYPSQAWYLESELRNSEP